MAELSINEAVRGFSHTYSFDFNDLKTPGFLSTIGAANQHRVGSLSPGGVIDTAILYLVTAAGTATDITLDFGFTGADPDDLIDNADVDAMTKIIANTGDGFTVGGDANTGNFVANNTAAAVDLLIEVNGTVASLTAGEWILAWNEKRVPLL